MGYGEFINVLVYLKSSTCASVEAQSQITAVTCFGRNWADGHWRIMLKAQSLILEQQKITIVCSVLTHVGLYVSRMACNKHLIMIALIYCSEKMIFILSMANKHKLVYLELRTFSKLPRDEKRQTKDSIFGKKSVPQTPLVCKALKFKNSPQ